MGNNTNHQWRTPEANWSYSTHQTIISLLGCPFSLFFGKFIFMIIFFNSKTWLYCYCFNSKTWLHCMRYMNFLLEINSASRSTSCYVFKSTDEFYLLFHNLDLSFSKSYQEKRHSNVFYFLGICVWIRPFFRK